MTTQEITRRAGCYERQAAGYSAFIPAPLPPIDLQFDDSLRALESRADQAIGRLDGVVSALPAANLFLSMYVRREAVLSSQIEGTHASLADVLENEAAQEEETVDVREITNYVRAMNHGLERLKDLPISRRLMCEVHKILMDRVRGGEPQKSPGEFRRTQNWIGGGSPASARFVPPPPEQVGDAFANLENYLHNEPATELVKAGIAHAQFETIHPFLDGNGRTGRLLITFWLVQRDVIGKPVLYPSLFFKQNKDEYIARLQSIRDQGDWEGWLAFFLDGMAQVAIEATKTARAILELRNADRILVSNELSRRAKALDLHDLLFARPTITARSVESALDVSQPTAHSLVADFERIGILRETTGRKSWRIFTYQRYLDLFSGHSDRD